MPQIFIQNGTQKITAYAAERTPLADVLSANGCPVGMPCGGSGKCGKCKVSISGSFLYENQHHQCDSAAELPACRIRVMGDCRVTLRDNQDISQLPHSNHVCVKSDANFIHLGAAIDIGTTTLEACLYDKSGFLAKVSSANPQRVYGADVITRLGHARDGKSEELAACIRKALDEMLAALAKKANRPPPTLILLSLQATPPC